MTRLAEHDLKDNGSTSLKADEFMPGIVQASLFRQGRREAYDRVESDFFRKAVPEWFREMTEDPKTVKVPFDSAKFPLLDLEPVRRQLENRFRNLGYTVSDRRVPVSDGTYVYTVEVTW